MLGGLIFWRLEHWRCTNAHLEVASVDLSVCFVLNAYLMHLGGDLSWLSPFVHFFSILKIN